MTLSPWLVGFALVPAVAFPFAFLRSPWRSTAPGIALMIFSTIVAVVMILTEARVLGAPFPSWLRSLIYLLIAGGLWTQLIVLLVLQRRDRRRDRRTLDA